MLFQQNKTRAVKNFEKQYKQVTLTILFVLLKRSLALIVHTGVVICLYSSSLKRVFRDSTNILRIVYFKRTSEIDSVCFVRQAYSSLTEF